MQIEPPDVPRTTSKQCLTIDLDAVGSAAASWGIGEGMSRDVACELLPTRSTPLLPPYSHMQPDWRSSVRDDFWGSGIGYSQYSTADLGEALPGRLPVWRLWQACGVNPVAAESGWLEAPAPRNVRSLCYHGASMQDGLRSTLRQLQPGDLVRSLADLGPPPDDRVSCIMAIPNTLLDEDHQDQLLRAIPYGSKLIWRPMAAILGLQHVLSDHDLRALKGTTLTAVDTRFGALSADVVKLDVVETEAGPLLVPERNWPTTACCQYQEIPAPHFRFAMAVCELYALPETDAMYWYLAYGSRCFDEFLNTPPRQELNWRVPLDCGLVELQVTPEDRVFLAEAILELDDEQTSFREQQLGGAASAGLLCDDVNSFLRAVGNRGGSQRCLFYGPWCESVILSQAFRRVISPSSLLRDMRVVSYDLSKAPFSLVGCGCAEFDRRLRNGLPTYMDRLRKLEIIVQDGMVIRPYCLIPGTTVDAGKEYVGEAVDRCFLNKGESKVHFWLQLESANRLRELEQDFHVSTEAREVLNLHPRQMPAQGRARVRVDNDHLFPSRDMWLDWECMQASDKTIEDLQNAMPLAYPPDLPGVRPDQWRFDTFTEFHLRNYLAGNGPKQRLVDRVRQTINGVSKDDKDLSGLGRVNVFGSDESNSPHSMQLHRFFDQLEADYEGSVGKTREIVLSTISWTYQGERFQKIRSKLYDTISRGFQGQGLSKIEFTACAQLFRTQDEFEALVSYIAEGLSVRGLNGPTNLIYCLRKLMCYRHDALESATEAECVQILWRIGAVLEQQVDTCNYEVTFHQSLVAIMFLLRRRRQDTHFLNLPADSHAITFTRHFPDVSSWRHRDEAGQRLDALLSLALKNLDGTARLEKRAFYIKLINETQKMLHSRGTLEGFVQLMSEESFG